MVPFWVASLETVLRAVVFVLPIFLSIQEASRDRRAGALLYLAGLLVYFGSWFPWIRGNELESVVFLVGPYGTPLLVFSGISVLVGSRTYFVASCVFVSVHVYGGLVKGGLV